MNSYIRHSNKGGSSVESVIEMLEPFVSVLFESTLRGQPGTRKTLTHHVEVSLESERRLKSLNEMTTRSMEYVLLQENFVKEVIQACVDFGMQGRTAVASERVLRYFDVYLMEWEGLSTVLDGQTHAMVCHMLLKPLYDRDFLRCRVEMETRIEGLWVALGRDLRDLAGRMAENPGLAISRRWRHLREMKEVFPDRGHVWMRETEI